MTATDDIPPDPPPPDDDPLWRTKDGREIPFSKMETGHMRNARRVITPWSKGERDEEKRRELKSWRKSFATELRKRDKAEGAPAAPSSSPPSSASIAANERQAAYKAEQKARASAYRAEQRDRQRAARKTATSSGPTSSQPLSRSDRPAGFGRSRAPVAPRRQRAPDHWSRILCIHDDADAATIEQAFRDQAKLAHPDAGGSAAAMRQLIAARDWALRENGDPGDDGTGTE